MGIRAKIALVAAAFLLGLAGSLLLDRIRPPRPQPVGDTGGAGEGPGYRYERVICMSPAVSEIVFALGAGERVAGVSQHTQYPPEAVEKPPCGGFVNPNYERIVALDPDLIISQGRAEDLRRFAVERDIAFAALPLTDLESIFQVIRQAGELLEIEAQGQLLASKMRYELAQVTARVSDRPPARVLLVTGRQTGTLGSINTVGTGSFLDGLLEAAGGRNVFSDLERAYATVSKEALVQRKPEVIVELHGEGGDHARLLRQVRDIWAGLPSLPAVRTGRIYVVESTYALIPGPRVVKLAERLARVIHGEGG